MVEKGYVYILTNSSFCGQWVKIGKTARSVEQRASELSTTGVPLPFKVFATLRTEKYEQAETLIHHLIDMLDKDCRVSKRREFFKIDPQSAADIFTEVAAVLDDAEFKQYGQEECKESSSGEEKVVSESGKRLLNFWDELKSYAKNRSSEVGELMTQKSLPQNWYDIHIGTGSCHIVLGVNGMSRFVKVGMFARGDEEIQNLLASKKDHFEKALGEEMEISGNKTLSMYAFHDFDISEHDKWSEAFDWFVEKIPLLRDAMREVLKNV